jgi:hypothetical protein
MKLINILVDPEVDINFLERFSFFANITSNLRSCIPGTTTIVYGYGLAKSAFPGLIDPLNRKVMDNLYWIPTKSEKYIGEKDESTAKLFASIIEEVLMRNVEEVEVDPVFGGFHKEDFANMSSGALIHNGRFEIYIGTFGISYKLYSIKKDSLEFIGVDPEQYYQSLIDINVKDGGFILEFDEMGLRELDKISDTKFVVEFIQAITGELINLDTLLKEFSSAGMVGPKKYLLLAYYMKILDNLATEYRVVEPSDTSTYSRILKSALVDKILSNCKIRVDIKKLQAIKLMSKNAEIARYLKRSIEGNGFISSKYYSRDKRTFRSFTKKGELNLINLNNDHILDSIVSRYDGGKIVNIDYKNYEYAISRALIFGESFPKDIHEFCMSCLPGMGKVEAKRINFIMMYDLNPYNVDDQIESVIEYLKEEYGEDNVQKYLDVIFTIRELSKEFTSKNVSNYRSHGYVVNDWGRKIYPKNELSIFNNIIQSNGVELLIDTIERLDQESKKENDWHILFQRFDSIYFDFSPGAIEAGKIDVVKNIMENINGKIDLSTNIKIGDSVYKLREL